MRSPRSIYAGILVVILALMLYEHVYAATLTGPDVHLLDWRTHRRHSFSRNGARGLPPMGLPVMFLFGTSGQRRRYHG